MHAHTPAVPQLLYDTVHHSTGQHGRTRHIRRTQPRYALFLHVARRWPAAVRIRALRCINVGHFRATGVPYVLEWGVAAATRCGPAGVPGPGVAVRSEHEA